MKRWEGGRKVEWVEVKNKPVVGKGKWEDSKEQGGAVGRKGGVGPPHMNI